MNKKKIYLAGVVLAASAFGAQALEITITPGSLFNDRELLKGTHDSQLVLKGAADVTDLALLRNISQSISSIDMSDLEIKAYKYETGNFMGKTEFKANEIPPYMLTGAAVNAVILPKNTAIIGESAFASTNIVNLTIPASVQTVGDYAYANCPLLGSANIPQPIELGKGVFKDCKRLTKVNFGYDINTIPESMFDGCSAYAEDIPATVITIGPFAYRATAIESLDLSHVRNIGDFAFSNMKNLSEITVDASHLESVGTGVFYNDKNFTSLPEWTGVISEVMLAKTSGKVNGKITSSTIGKGAFAGNTDIDSVSFSASVSKIEPYAFRNVTSLKSIDARDLGSSIPDVDAKSFSGLENEEGKYDINLYVDKGEIEHWKTHPVWSLFKLSDVESGVDDIFGDDAAGVEIAVSLRNGELDVTSTDNIDSVNVYTLSGIEVLNAAPGATTFRATNLPTDEVLIVKVTSAGKTKVAKLR